MELLFAAWALPAGLVSGIAVVVGCTTKIIIFRMAIKDVPAEHRADVIKATSLVFGRGHKESKQIKASRSTEAIDSG